MCGKESLPANKAEVVCVKQETRVQRENDNLITRLIVTCLNELQ